MKTQKARPPLEHTHACVYTCESACVCVCVCVCVCKYEYPVCTRLHMYIVKMFTTGWLTLGPELSSSNYNKEKYTEFFVDHPVIPNTDDIETLSKSQAFLCSLSGFHAHKIWNRLMY